MRSTNLKRIWIIQSLALGLIFLLGVFLYFYKLEKIPSGFYIDEALPGYNAYSLLSTGKDEYGKPFPLFLRFYGSYNPPLFTYLTVPSIALFGLNVFSVRFVSALAGLLAMFPFYFLLKGSNLLKHRATPFLGTLLFVISPWIILYSRVGYEVSLGLLLFSVGALFIWYALHEFKLLAPGFILLSLSTYATYTERFLVPMFIIGLLVIFREKLLSKKARKNLLIALFAVFLTQIPHFFLLTTPAFFPKADLLGTVLISQQATKIAEFLPFPVAYLLAFIREFLSQYFTYFSPRSLFFLPDPDLQRSIPELSVFYFWMVIPYFVGLYCLWKEKSKAFSRFIILLAIISPIPASFTHDPFSTHRALPVLLPLALVIGIGIDRLLSNLPKKIWIPAFSFLLIFSLILLWRSYFVFLPNERARYWGYGFQQLAAFIQSKSETNFVIDQTRIKPAYIYLAFFLKYPPGDFQKTVNLAIKDNYYAITEFDPYYKFANIETRNIYWEEDIYKEQILVGDEFTISSQQAQEHFLEQVFELVSPVDEIIFRGYKTNPTKKCRQDPINLHCKNI